MKKDEKEEKTPAKKTGNKTVLKAALTAGAVAVGAGVVGLVSNGKLFKQTQTNALGKQAVQKTVVLASRPAYENYLLPYDERKTALDNAVKNGDLKIEDGTVEDGMSTRRYVGKNDGHTVAEESLEKFSSQWQPFSIVFVTPDIAPEYPIFEGGKEVQVQGNGTVERRDCFNLSEDGDNFVLAFSFQHNDNVEIMTDYGETGLPYSTTVETPTQKEVYFFPGSDEFQDDACHISTTLTEDGKKVVREVVYSATGEITYQKGKPIEYKENSNASSVPQAFRSTSFER